jgi:hypothetical protein
MTSKVYRTAQGKSVDLGTIMLKNEHVRAVGNMNVNARGDKLDSNNQVIETKTRQIQKQNARLTTASSEPVYASVGEARRARQKNSEQETAEVIPPSMPDMPEEPKEQEIVTAPPPQDEIAAGRVPLGGLAGAIARSREIKQELEKTRRQKQQDQGVRKI